MVRERDGKLLEKVKAREREYIYRLARGCVGFLSEGA